MIAYRAHALDLSWYDGTGAPDGSLPPLPDEFGLADAWVWRPTPDTTHAPAKPLIVAAPAADPATPFPSPAANAPAQPFLPAGTSQFVLSSLTAQDAIVFGSPATTASSTLADDNSDIAMGANLARAMFGVDGTGISIGILSDSFNVNGGEAADIAAGNLPDANDIHILAEGPAGATDEGRAMAELVHQVAPGAQIYFYTGDNSETDFATGIQTLANAGCQVIVDDLAYFDEPFFQDGGAVQKAVETVVGEGVDYFTSAGNVANDFYEHSWISLATTLPGVSGTVTAFDFGTAAGGAASPFETISIAAGGTCNLDLQWDQPFKTIGGSDGTVNSLSIYMFVDGSLMFSATTDATTGGGNPFQFLGVKNEGSSAGTVQIAVVDLVGPVPGFFKIIDQNDEGTWGATFIDPNAGVGSGTVFGHALVADANTVGAVDYANTPAFGVRYAGAGEFLLGRRRPIPVRCQRQPAGQPGPHQQGRLHRPRWFSDQRIRSVQRNLGRGTRRCRRRGADVAAQPPPDTRPGDGGPGGRRIANGRRPHGGRRGFHPGSAGAAGRVCRMLCRRHTHTDELRRVPDRAPASR